MEPITLRKASLQDLVQLQQIGRQTFFETFAASNSEQNLNAYLEEGFSLAKLTAELQNPNSMFYFAELDHAFIGYLKVNTGPAQTELQDEHALEIERIYVLQAYHGKKVGQLLYEKALQLAQQAKASYLWLGVWEKNPRAIQFYRKNGFVEFDKHTFIVGDDVQTDLMMKRPVAATH